MFPLVAVANIVRAAGLLFIRSDEEKQKLLDECQAEARRRGKDLDWGKRLYDSRRRAQIEAEEEQTSKELVNAGTFWARSIFAFVVITVVFAVPGFLGFVWQSLHPPPRTTPPPDIYIPKKDDGWEKQNSRKQLPSDLFKEHRRDLVAPGFMGAESVLCDSPEPPDSCLDEVDRLTLKRPPQDR